MSKIERSNQIGKFTLAECRAKVKESQAYWSSPAGQAERRKLDARQRECRGKGTRFPELAKRGTKPAVVSPLAMRRRLLDY
jgi:hypothetical protein